MDFIEHLLCASTILIAFLVTIATMWVLKSSLDKEMDIQYRKVSQRHSGSDTEGWLQGHLAQVPSLSHKAVQY